LRLDKIAAVRKAAAAAWPEVLAMLGLFGVDAATAAPADRAQTAVGQECQSHIAVLDGAAKATRLDTASQRSTSMLSRSNATKHRTMYTR
jgi:hypothetical protein